MGFRTARLPIGMARFRRTALLAALAAFLPAAAAADDGWPSKVSAKYKITFNGFDIGSFRFDSSIGPRSYSLTGSAELSALLGAFKWTGATRSSGALAAGEPKPADYAFNYKSNSKKGSVAMTFSGGRVANATVVPPSSQSKRTVPLTERHLEGVLDPLSAVMAMSRGRQTNPCGRTISIFDGKQRFDLELSYRRQQNVIEAKPSGQPGVAFVCRVRYVPIAGHKDNDETRTMAANTGIEVALRPIPSANILIPYQITIPTALGSAVLTSQRVEITTGMRQIALVH